MYSIDTFITNASYSLSYRFRCWSFVLIFRLLAGLLDEVVQVSSDEALETSRHVALNEVNYSRYYYQYYQS